MLQEIEELQKEATAEIESASDLNALEELRVKLAGRKSRLREIMSSIGSLPADERPVVGHAGGRLKTAIEEALASRQQELETDSDVATGIVIVANHCRFTVQIYSRF